MRELSVGLFLTNQHPVGADQLRALDEQIAMVHAARDAGWQSLWAGQHYLSESLTHVQPQAYLARLAPEAGDMRIGIGILLLALHNPVEVAEAYATLDVMCRGRLTFGVGLGYRQVEYDAFGLAGVDKVARFEANLRLVEALWTGEPVDADLPWCRLRGATLNLLPVQRPRPPLWMAANGDKAVERAARMADTWMINPHAAASTITRQLELFHAARADAALPPPPELPLMREVFCARDRATALQLARPFLADKYAVYADWGQDKALPGQEDFRTGFDELEQQRFVIGSPEDCLRQLLPWRTEVGVDHLILRTHWSGMPVQSSLASIDLLSREVLPTLRAAPSQLTSPQPAPSQPAPSQPASGGRAAVGT